MSPLQRQVASKRQAPDSGETPTPGLEPKQAHSVLVVDDEPAVRDALRLILEPEFRVLTADRGEAALKILEHERVSVMTLDLRMPGWGGPETLFKIREIDSHLEVVIISGYASYSETMRALRLRAFDLVAKPFDSSRVRETVRRAALRCQTRRQTSSRYEVLDGLTNRLMESIHGLSPLELRMLDQSTRAKLSDLRALAQSLLGRFRTP